MVSINYKKITIQILLLLFIFFLDRISKNYILDVAETNQTVNIYVNSFINFILIWNTGIGFGLFTSENPIFYNIVTALISIINLIIIYIIISSKSLQSYFFILILGGSLGNLFDRIYYSAVPDFIDVNYKGFHWFIFNVADIFITIGIICLIFSEIINYKKVNA